MVLSTGRKSPHRPLRALKVPRALRSPWIIIFANAPRESREHEMDLLGASGYSCFLVFVYALSCRYLEFMAWCKKNYEFKGCKLKGYKKKRTRQGLSAVASVISYSVILRRTSGHNYS